MSPNLGPSLYEVLTQNFIGGLPMQQVSEEDRPVLSVLDNLQRLFNSRAGQLAHLPDYGLPDMSQILQGMPSSAQELLRRLRQVIRKYEPRIMRLDIVLLPQTQPGQLAYSLEAELKGMGQVRFGTLFTAEGKVLVRHLRQQQWLAHNNQEP